MNAKTLYFDGKKSVNIESLPDTAWDWLSGNEGDTLDTEKLYSIVAHLYRCVTIRGNGVATMPFEIRRGDNVVAAYNGSTFEEPDKIPQDLAWTKDLPDLFGKTETAAILGGQAYWEFVGNILGTRKPTSFRWLAANTITPYYNGVPGVRSVYDNTKPLGEIAGFVRRLYGMEKELTPEEVIYFWLPDHAVEMGAAVNYPGKAVLQNAGVIGSLDLFLRGYFDRGLIKATLLTYEKVNARDLVGLKEWWQRVVLGAKNAFGTHIMRGDIKPVVIGEGIKDLRDSSLTKEEKDAIAIGLGVPPSKLLPVGVNRATKDGDDRAFIEDTILPEVSWIYKVANEQILTPIGYSIIAQPQLLRVMQTDEMERSQAFTNYRNGGMSIEAVVEMLGIHVSDNVDIKEEKQPIPAALIQQQPKEEPEEEPEEEDRKTLELFDLMDKRDESKQFLRWCKKRDFIGIEVSDFETEHLTHDEKVAIAIKAIRKNRTDDTEAIVAMDAYGDKLAAFIDSSGDLSQSDFTVGMRHAVHDGLLTVYKEAIGIKEDDPLLSQEQAKFDGMIDKELAAVSGFVETLYTERGKAFSQIREKLQDIGGNLGGRLSMWKNAARRIFNWGKLWGRDDFKMTWYIGATEQHCGSCLAQHGKTRTKSEWQQLASILIYPQSRALECKGYNCDCELRMK